MRALAAFAIVAAVATFAACKDDSHPSTSSGTPSAAAAPAGHLQLTEAPPGGDVESVVRAALSKATASQRRVIVYAGASWCEPCQRFHKAAEKGELDTAFPDVDIVAFDMDRDSERLASAGYYSKLIPLFALPSPDGTASGKQVEGGVKGDGAVAYITPRLKSLLGM